MTPEERNAYARGYTAGRKKTMRDRNREAERDAFWQRCFVSAIPAFITAQGWTIDGKAATTLNQRLELAGRAADESLDLASRKWRIKR